MLHNENTVYTSKYFISSISIEFPSMLKKEAFYFIIQMIDSNIP